jgi:hypothetical protein
VSVQADTAGEKSLCASTYLGRVRLTFAYL